MHVNPTNPVGTSRGKGAAEAERLLDAIDSSMVRDRISELRLTLRRAQAREIGWLCSVAYAEIRMWTDALNKGVFGDQEDTDG